VSDYWTVNGELAEVIGLATHGSRWLSDGNGEPPALDQSNSTFQFVGAVQFLIAREGRFGRDERTAAVQDWLRARRSAGIDRMYLVIPGVPSTVDQHSLAALANAGQWGLLGVGKRQSEVWRATWTVANRDAPDRRIWSVSYNGTRATPAAPQCLDIEDAAAALRHHLENAQAFAEQEELGSWVEWFRRALNDVDEIPYHDDMLPDSFGGEPRRLVAMATRSWVFGGMGSWNDLGFADPDVRQHYENLSRLLYGAVLRAFVAGVNHGVG
jgi:hypothetical protein